jgi:predicted amidophosphoribosyltransferase
MPGYKHPCPFCTRFIDSGVAACPFCGVTDPFTQGRCPDCRAPLQAGWVACPKCGRSLTAADAAATPGAATAAPPPPALATTPAGEPAPAAAPGTPTGTAARCTGCGAALLAGARFCTECGTLVS